MCIRDRDGDGDFDFHGEVQISLRGMTQTLLRLTDADIQMDPSVLHVTNATVYAAVSEGAGLHDALFKGSFDIDRFTGEVLSFSAEAPPEGDSNPYYAPGGLALTYSGFKLNFDGVEAFAKMAMPVPLFEGVNLDLADMTGLLVSSRPVMSARSRLTPSNSGTGMAILAKASTPSKFNLKPL